MATEVELEVRSKHTEQEEQLNDDEKVAYLEAEKDERKERDVAQGYEEKKETV